MIHILLSLLLILFSFSDPVLAKNKNPSLLELLPSSIIQVSNRSRYIFIAELELGLLHIYKKQAKDRFQLIESIAISIGKSGFGKEVEGDDKTPVGVYRITSHLTNKQLDDFYGKAAYPVNYPNVWDKLNNRTGYGIWIHAEPIGFTEKVRPYLDSNGCIVLSNNDIERISPYIDNGYTYVISTPRVNLESIEKRQEKKDSLLGSFKSWQRSWQKINEDDYVGFYSSTFRNKKVDKQGWIRSKKKVFKNTDFIQLKVSDISMFEYPEEENLVWVEFYQSYVSNNYKSLGWKQQLWSKEESNIWRIIYEDEG